MSENNIKIGKEWVFYFREIKLGEKEETNKYSRRKTKWQERIMKSSILLGIESATKLDWAVEIRAIYSLIKRSWFGKYWIISNKD